MADGRPLRRESQKKFLLKSFIKTLFAMTRSNQKPNFKVGTLNLQGGNKEKCMIAGDM